MVEKCRRPGGPAYYSKQKLVAAACALPAERGFGAMIPQMFLQQYGVGHGANITTFWSRGRKGSCSIRSGTRGKHDRVP